MDEFEVIYRFQHFMLEAERVGLRLRATCMDYVLTDSPRQNAPVMSATTLDAIEAAIERRKEAIRRL